MIEIEKKFILYEGDKERLTAGAKFIGKKQHTDTYYDNDDYKLTTKDWWLRQRNGVFELKRGLAGNETTKEGVDHYEEITNEEVIRKLLNIKKGKNLATDLEKNGYRPFGSIKTARQTYRLGEFRIDIDSVDFGWEVTEIELLVKTEKEILEATQKILDFAKSRGLKLEALSGKAVELIRRNNPKHFAALVKAGVV